MSTKFPLQLTTDRLILNAIVRGKRFNGMIPFLVDTGSPHTFIGSMDTMRLNIPLNGEIVRTAKLGGSSIGLYDIGGIRISIEDDKGQLERINIETFCATRDLSEKRQPCPSLLGVDFMKQNSLALYFNPCKGIAYLEKEE